MLDFTKQPGVFGNRKDDKEPDRNKELTDSPEELTVLAAKYLPLILRPHTPIACGALVRRAIPFPQEIHTSGTRRSGTMTRVLI